MFDVVFDPKILAHALSFIQLAVVRQSVSSVLSNVLMEPVSSTRCRLMSTDYEVTLFAEIDCEVKGDGKLALNGTKLFEVSKSFDVQKTVRIKGQPNDWGVVTSGKSRFTIAGYLASDYPEVKVPEGMAFETVQAGLLERGIRSVAFSMSEDETRMNLNGVLLRGTEGKLLLVATDGHRLSKFESPFEGLDSQDVILSRHAVGVLKPLFELGNPTIDVALMRTQAAFRASYADGTFTMLGRCIDDGYPDFQRVIPRNHKLSLKVDSATLRSAAKQALGFSDKRSNALKLEVSENTILVTSKNADTGSAFVEVECEYEEAPVVIGVNGHYLIECLSHVPGVAYLRFADEYSPLLWTLDGSDECELVLMPMRV